MHGGFGFHTGWSEGWRSGLDEGQGQHQIQSGSGLRSGAESGFRSGTGSGFERLRAAMTSLQSVHVRVLSGPGPVPGCTPVPATRLVVAVLVCAGMHVALRLRRGQCSGASRTATSAGPDRAAAGALAEPAPAAAAAAVYGHSSSRSGANPSVRKVHSGYFCQGTSAWATPPTGLHCRHPFRRCTPRQTLLTLSPSPTPESASDRPAPLLAATDSARRLLLTISHLLKCLH